MNFLKFSIFGLIRFTIMFSFYVILINRMHPLIAISITWPISIILSQYFHQRYLFQVKRKIDNVIVKYFLIYFSIFLLNALILFIFVDIISLNPIYSQFFILIFLSIINYQLIDRLYK